MSQSFREIAFHGSRRHVHSVRDFLNTHVFVAAKSKCLLAGFWQFGNALVNKGLKRIDSLRLLIGIVMSPGNELIELFDILLPHTFGPQVI